MYNHILVPVDGSQQADRALDHAIDLVRSLSRNVRLTVLHVDHAPVFIEPAIIDVSSILAEEGRRVVMDATDKLQDSGIEFDTLVANGDPASIVNDTARDRGMDLIVIGSRGVGLVSEILLGSVSHSVAQHAPCPVLIVK
ncbi:universal stress protein [Cohnella sp. GCM10027633]|uniref:universal stress protein n=1 Tax=unclassified Cohnella TaxID=2636738 RepID=UPI0036301BAA